MYTCIRQYSRGKIRYVVQFRKHDELRTRGHTEVVSVDRPSMLRSCSWLSMTLSPKCVPSSKTHTCDACG